TITERLRPPSRCASSASPPRRGRLHAPLVRLLRKQCRWATPVSPRCTAQTYSCRIWRRLREDRACDCPNMTTSPCQHEQVPDGILAGQHAPHVENHADGI